MNLNRTVPFITEPPTSTGPVLLLDRVEAPLTAATNERLLTRIDEALGLGPADGVYVAAEAEALVRAQYEASLEYIYSQPVWRILRDRGHGTFLRAYLLENRHYLAAAPFRMAPGVGAAPRPARLLELQAEHVVEEADHDTFFENGLARIGCPRPLVRAARPAPVTLEWIYLMRGVAEPGSLAAAVCSGLLEYTAGNREAVAGWHRHIAQGQLDPGAVEAIFEHVRTDLELGHGANWRDALHAAGVIPAEQLADILNDVSLVAEIIVRWIRSIGDGLQGDLVDRLRELPTPEGEPEVVLGGEADGLPVWPAEIYHSVAHGRSDLGKSARVALAEGFSLGRRLRDAYPQGLEERSPESVAADLAAQFTDEVPEHVDAVWLEKLVTGWMRAIDGHQLWATMAQEPTYPLVYGFMVENYHYVSAIWQHCGAAIASCPDPRIRLELVHHLKEEFAHGSMFEHGIEKARGERYGGLRISHMRQLATTRAFTSALRGLAQRDWKAYVVGIAYLQLTLRSEPGQRERHSGFYRSVTERLPEAEPLLAAMRRHDEEDGALGHGDDVRSMLDLITRHEIGLESLAGAALVPQLTWSFLDGIRQHYGVGDAAVVQRRGWTTKPIP